MVDSLLASSRKARRWDLLVELYGDLAVEGEKDFWRIFEKDFDPKSLAGCILFFGASAHGLKDLRATPLDPAAGWGVDERSPTSRIRRQEDAGRREQVGHRG